MPLLCSIAAHRTTFNSFWQHLKKDEKNRHKSEPHNETAGVRQGETSVSYIFEKARCVTYLAAIFYSLFIIAYNINSATVQVETCHSTSFHCCLWREAPWAEESEYPTKHYPTLPRLWPSSVCKQFISLSSQWTRHRLTNQSSHGGAGGDGDIKAEKV